MNGWNNSSMKRFTGKPGQKTSKKISSSWHATKRGLASLFVCLFIFIPIVLTISQWTSVFGLHFSIMDVLHSSKDAGGKKGSDTIAADSRKTTALPAMQVRAADAGNSTIKPFEQPLVTVTFDDGWESVYTQAAPLLQKHGIHSTQYVLSGEEQYQGYMTFAQIKALRQAGHDIGCHTQTHPDLTKLSATELASQLTGCKSVLESKLGIPIKDFASPYGSANPTTIAAIQKVFRSQRNTNGDITTNRADDQDINTAANFNRYNIIAVTIRNDTTEAEITAAIDYTVQHNGWLVLTYHDIDNTNSTFALDSKSLGMQLAAISKAPVRIVTIGQTLDALEKKGIKE